MTPRENLIIFRVNDQELEIIRKRKSLAQFKTISAFMRNRSLCDDSSLAHIGFPYERMETLIALNRSAAQLRDLISVSNADPETDMDERVWEMIETIDNLLDNLSGR